MKVILRFEQSDACAEEHNDDDGGDDAEHAVPYNTTDGEWVQLTYDSIRDQNGGAVAVLADCGCWQLDDLDDDRFYSDVIICFEPDTKGA